MADENLDNQDNAPQDNTPQPSQAEVEARSAGWVPKEEFEGDEHKWVDAGEFLRRGELFAKIEKQNKELKDVRKALAQMAEHNAKVKQAAYKEALETLKAEKKKAFEEGDADAIIEIDEKILETKEQAKQAERADAEQIKQEAQELHPEFKAWVDRNAWYAQSAPMKAFADALGADLATKGLSPSEVLKEVEKQVKEEFPQKFRNPNKDKPGAVEGASNKAARPTNGYQPTDMERQIAKRFVRQGLFKTEADYYKQLEEANK
jgi:hypothetical protein